MTKIVHASYPIEECIVAARSPSTVPDTRASLPPFPTLPAPPSGIFPCKRTTNPHVPTGCRKVCCLPSKFTAVAWSRNHSTRALTALYCMAALVPKPPKTLTPNPNPKPRCTADAAQDPPRKISLGQLQIKHLSPRMRRAGVCTPASREPPPEEPHFVTRVSDSVLASRARPPPVRSGVVRKTPPLKRILHNTVNNDENHFEI